MAAFFFSTPMYLYKIHMVIPLYNKTTYRKISQGLEAVRLDAEGSISEKL